MNAALKRTTVILIVVVMMAATLLVSLITTHHEGAYATTEKVPKMAVSDLAYKTPVGVGITSKKATPEVIAELETAAEEAAAEETNEAWTADYEPEGQVEYAYNEITYYDPYGDEASDASDGGDGRIDADGVGNDTDGGDDYINANVDGNWHAGASFAFDGVYTDEGSGYSFTYYSENVRPGGGLNIPGRHVNDEGYVVDGDGNICLASDNFPNGTVISIPFGNGVGVVYDHGSGCKNLDIYVSW